VLVITQYSRLLPGLRPDVVSVLRQGAHRRIRRPGAGRGAGVDRLRLRGPAGTCLSAGAGSLTSGEDGARPIDVPEGPGGGRKSVEEAA
jgi:hypothetical protein